MKFGWKEGKEIGKTRWGGKKMMERGGEDEEVEFRWKGEVERGKVRWSEEEEWTENKGEKMGR